MLCLFGGEYLIVSILIFYMNLCSCGMLRPSKLVDPFVNKTKVESYKKRPFCLNKQQGNKNLRKTQKSLPKHPKNMVPGCFGRPETPDVFPTRQMRVSDITAGSGCADPQSRSGSARSAARSVPTPVLDASPGRARAWRGWGRENTILKWKLDYLQQDLKVWYLETCGYSIMSRMPEALVVACNLFRFLQPKLGR